MKSLHLRGGDAGFFVSRHLPEIVDQDTLDVVIPPGVGIFYPDQFEAVFAADLLLFAVAALDDGVVAVLAAIQLDG